jgi:hypothetical protein
MNRRLMKGWVVISRVFSIKTATKSLDTLFHDLIKGLCLSFKLVVHNLIPI